MDRFDIICAVIVVGVIWAVVAVNRYLARHPKVKSGLCRLAVAGVVLVLLSDPMVGALAGLVLGLVLCPLFAIYRRLMDWIL